MPICIQIAASPGPALALRPGGTLAVWSAPPDRQFTERLRNGGFIVALERVRGRLRGGPKHLIFLAERPAA